MVSTTQQRILRWLSQFSKELEDAWDVPRELSLPGLADAMGVVRSALNAPLSALMEQGLVHQRQAHVIGGGRRKRNVYHITKTGLEVESELPNEIIQRSRRSSTKLKGNVPPVVKLIGRDAEIKQAIELVESENSLLITGLPGIGKTSFVRELGEQWVEQGFNVNWFTMTGFDDLSSILDCWAESTKAPTSPEASLDWILRMCSNHILVIDEIQELHPRHSESVLEFIQQLLQSSTNGPSLVLVSRAPSPIENPSSTIQLGTLDIEAAESLLDESMEPTLRREIVEALGCHPLALKLHDPSSELPEKGADIQDYVKKTVLSALPDEAIPALDELAAMPIPTAAERLQNHESVGLLDEHALLRWLSLPDKLTELQHLIRNVRRTQWNEKRTREIHQASANYWMNVIDGDARLIELHHRIKADDDDLESYIEHNYSILMENNTGAIASLLSDALDSKPSTEGLWRMAIQLALDRGESNHADTLLQKIPGEGNDAYTLELKARSALQSGKTKEAETYQEQALQAANGPEKVRISLSALARKLDDRLPGNVETSILESIEDGIAELDMSELNSELKPATLVSIAILRHTVFVQKKEWNQARGVRQQLESISSKDDPLLLELELRASVAAAEYESSDWHRETEALRRLVDNHPHPLRRVALQLVLVERLFSHDIVESKEVLSSVILPSEAEIGNTTAGRRLAAIHWYWKGSVDESNRLECWREAIHRFKTAECLNAAQSLTNLMHQLLR